MTQPCERPLSWTPSQLSLWGKLKRRILRYCFRSLSHAGQNYWMLIGWDRGHFFLIKRALFVIKGMITWCWLAEHACIKLVSRFKRILKRNFRDALLLSLILTRSFHLNMKENQHATKVQSFGGKAKGFFLPKTYWFAAWKQFEWGWLVWRARQNFVASKLKVNFFVLLRVALLVLQA